MQGKLPYVLVSEQRTDKIKHRATADQAKLIDQEPLGLLVPLGPIASFQTMSMCHCCLDSSHHACVNLGRNQGHRHRDYRSEEHTSELQSLMRISYAVFCLKKKK